MPPNFAIQADLQIKGPSNLNAVVSKVKAALSNMAFNVNLKVSSQSVTATNNLSKSMLTLNQRIRAVNASATTLTQTMKNMTMVFRQVASVANSVNSAAKSIKSFGSAAKKSGIEMQTFGEMIGASAKRFAAFAAATTIMVGFSSAVNDAVRSAIAFQDQMIKLRQIGGGNRESIRGLADEVDKLSTRLGVSSDELIKVTNTLRQAGNSAADTKTLLSGIAKTDLAPTFDNMGKTAEGVIAIMNQFKIPAKDMEKALGSINKVSADFAVESGDVIEAVKRAGAQFKSSGGDLNEFLGVFTSIRATTRLTASTVAAGMNTIFSRISKPEAVAMLKRYNVELYKMGKFVGPTQAIKELNKALEEVSENDARFIGIANQLGGTHRLKELIPMIKAAAMGQDAMQSALEGTNSLEKDQEMATESLANKINKLSEEFKSLFRTITNDAVFQSFISKTLDLAIAVTQAVKALSPLIPMLATFAAFKGFQGVTSVMRDGFGSLGVVRGVQMTRRAGGGIIPGSGDGDTVPAMLTPGEFVIKKSSAQKIGYDRLAKMNQVGHYAQGGVVLPADVAQYLQKLGFGNMKNIGKIVDSIVFKELRGKMDNVGANFDHAPGGYFNQLNRGLVVNTHTDPTGEARSVSSKASTFVHELVHAMDHEKGKKLSGLQLAGGIMASNKEGDDKNHYYGLSSLARKSGIVLPHGYDPNNRAEYLAYGASSYFDHREMTKIGSNTGSIIQPTKAMSAFFKEFERVIMKDIKEFSDNVTRNAAIASPMLGALGPGNMRGIRGPDRNSSVVSYAGTGEKYSDVKNWPNVVHYISPPGQKPRIVPKGIPGGPISSLYSADFKHYAGQTGIETTRQFQMSSKFGGHPIPTGPLSSRFPSAPMGPLPHMFRGGQSGAYKNPNRYGDDWGLAYPTYYGQDVRGKALPSPVGGPMNMRSQIILPPKIAEAMNKIGLAGVKWEKIMNKLVIDPNLKQNYFTTSSRTMGLKGDIPTSFMHELTHAIDSHRRIDKKGSLVGRYDSNFSGGSFSRLAFSANQLDPLSPGTDAIYRKLYSPEKYQSMIHPEALARAGSAYLTPFPAEDRFGPYYEKRQQLNARYEKHVVGAIKRIGLGGPSQYNMTYGAGVPNSNAGFGITTHDLYRPNNRSIHSPTYGPNPGMIGGNGRMPLQLTGPAPIGSFENPIDVGGGGGGNSGGGGGNGPNWRYAGGEIDRFRAPLAVPNRGWGPWDDSFHATQFRGRYGSSSPVSFPKPTFNQRFGNFMGTRMGMGLAFAGMAAPYAAERTLGTAREPGVFGRGGSLFGSVLGGTLAGGAMGAMTGNPFIALGGAAIGAVSALVKFKNEVSDININKMTEKIEGSLANVNTKTGRFNTVESAANYKEGMTSLYQTIKDNHTWSYGYQEQFKKDTVKPMVDQTLNKFKEMAIANPGKNFSQLREEADPGMGKLLYMYGDLSKQGMAELEAFIDNLNLQNQYQKELDLSYASLVVSSDKLSRTIDMTATNLEKDFARNAVGRGGAISAGSDFMNISALGGTGKELFNFTKQGGGLDQMGDFLQKTLLSSAKNGFLEKDSVENTLDAEMEKSPLFKGMIGKFARASVMNKLVGENGAKTLTNLNNDPTALRNLMMDDLEKLRPIEQKASQELSRITQTFAGSALSIQDTRNRVAEGRELASQIDLKDRETRGQALLTNNDQHFFDRSGDVISPADQMTAFRARFIQKSFVASQERFGVNAKDAVNPEAILGNLQSESANLAKLKAGANNARINGTGEDFSLRIAESTSRMKDFQEALKNLANSTNVLEAAQHQLEQELQKEASDKAGRKSTAETLAFGSRGDIVKMMMAENMIGVAAQQGHLENFSDEQRQMVLERLQATSGVVRQFGRQRVTGENLIDMISGQYMPETMMRQKVVDTPNGRRRVSVGVADSLDNVQDISNTMGRAANMTNKFNKDELDTQIKEHSTAFIDAIGKMTEKLNEMLKQPQKAVAKADGGIIFSPKGTDTVPAMLTPGEMVMNRKAVAKNKAALTAMNQGVVYKADGGMIGDPTVKDRIDEINRRKEERYQAQLESIEKSKYRQSVRWNTYNGNLNRPKLANAETEEQVSMFEQQRTAANARGDHRASISANNTMMKLIAGSTGTQPEVEDAPARRMQQNFTALPPSGPLARPVRGRNRANNPGAAGPNQEQRQQLAQQNQNNQKAGVNNGKGNVNDALDQSAKQMIDTCKPLIDALNNFPRELTIRREGKIEIILNGVESLRNVKGDLEKEIMNKISEKIREETIKTIKNMPG